MFDPAGRRTTLTDVARLSGVSTATASYVLNARPGQTISEPTRRRVLLAATELGYRANASAQALAGGKSRLVILDQSDVPAGSYVDASMNELAAAFEKRGYIPVVDRHSGARPDHALLVALCESVSPSAVVTFAPLPGRVMEQLARAGTEKVVHLAESQEDITALVARSADIQVRHLAALGHRRLAYAPSPDPGLAKLSAIRLDAIRAAADDLGCSMTALTGSLVPATIAEQLNDYHRDFLPTAVAAYNDEVAMTVIAAASHANLAVPSDLAVAGIDDSVLSRLTVPGLTSVRMRPPGHRSPDETVSAILDGSFRSVSTDDYVVEIVRRSST